jgi:hypothetical protein
MPDTRRLPAPAVPLDYERNLGILLGVAAVAVFLPALLVALRGHTKGPVVLKQSSSGSDHQPHDAGTASAGTSETD